MDQSQAPIFLESHRMRFQPMSNGQRTWVGHGAEALDAAQASGPLFVGGSVVEKSCDGCTPGPMVHTLLKHTDDRN
ncbi:hypothetical protein PRNP1_000447 [Phytophthora ramorum]